MFCNAKSITMAKKENKGGELTNKQVEKDLKTKCNPDQQNWYRGAQDTGDQKIRSLGNEVQRNDGLPDEEINERNTEE
jgi:hypothetical protein